MFGSAPFGSAPFGSGGDTATSASASDSLTLSDTAAQDILPLIAEALGLTDSTSASATLFGALTSSTQIEDSILLAWLLLASDSTAVADTVTATPYWAGQIIETLLATGAATSQLAATSALTQAIALNDAVRYGFDVAAVDSPAFADVFAALLTAAAAIVDAATVTDTTAYGVSLTLLLDDSTAVTATPVGALQAIETLSDGVVLFASVRVASGEYSCWVLNTENRAPSEYRNYEFNSFCEFPPGSGTYYGASATGLYRLEGDDDDGTAIDAWVRTGLWNLGTGKKKRLPSMYLGYTSDGTMVLKVISSENGQKKEDWYRMTPRTADSTRSNRIKIGRGLSSVYFGFELHNVDGADFALDEVQLFPMVTERRV